MISSDGQELKSAQKEAKILKGSKKWGAALTFAAAPSLFKFFPCPATEKLWLEGIPGSVQGQAGQGWEQPGL